MREQLHISQIEMASQLGITQSALSRWERTGRGLTEGAISKLGKFIEDRSISQPANREFTSGVGADNGRATARIRKALGMRQQELSALCGISRTVLSMFENGYLELSPSDFENLIRILKRQVEECGYEAIEVHAATGAANSTYEVHVGSEIVEHLLRPAAQPQLRELESQLKTYGDPRYRLKIAEDESKRDRTKIDELTNELQSEKQRSATAEKEIADHKRHKELLGNFAAAQATLIALQNQKISGLEGNPSRAFDQGAISTVPIDADIVEAQRNVNECHQAIMAELERKASQSPSNN